MSLPKVCKDIMIAASLIVGAEALAQANLGNPSTTTPGSTIGAGSVVSGSSPQAVQRPSGVGTAPCDPAATIGSTRYCDSNSTGSGSSFGTSGTTGGSLGGVIIETPSGTSGSATDTTSSGFNTDAGAELNGRATGTGAALGNGSGTLAPGSTSIPDPSRGTGTVP